MPSHYGNGSMKKNSPKAKKNVGKKTPKGMHRMPDGSFMKGENDGGNSKPKSKKDEKEDVVESMDLKEGALKKMLKVKDGDKPLGIMELMRTLKTENGKMFKFRGSEIKMTPLMRKRINTAMTLIRMSKKKK